MRITDDDATPLHRVYLTTDERGWRAHIKDERFWEADESRRVEQEVTIYRADDGGMVF